jgi:hypothetical protein
MAQAATLNRDMNTLETLALEPASSAEAESAKPRKLKKGDPGWIEAYRRELIMLRKLGCFIPDDLFPKSAP